MNWIELDVNDGEESSGSATRGHFLFS